MTVKPESSSPEKFGFEAYQWQGRSVTKEEFEKLSAEWEDYCGLEPVSLEGADPWYRRTKLCQAHDASFRELKDNEWRVFGTFTKNIAKGMFDGAVMLLTGPLYLLVGGLGGVIRYQQLKKRRQLKEQNENLPPDLGDGI